jgi:hypothetical protein
LVEVSFVNVKDPAASGAKWAKSGLVVSNRLIGFTGVEVIWKPRDQDLDGKSYLWKGEQESQITASGPIQGRATSPA